MTSATLLLPPVARLEGAALPPLLARALARADLLPAAPAGSSQLGRHFPGLPADSGSWPVAALTRQRDAGDAGTAQWVRADPAHIAADMQGVRMLAHGPAMGLTAEQAQELVVALQPSFAEHGIELSAPEPARWYLRVPDALALPALVDVDTVLGDDLFDHLPAGEVGRLWRSLLSDTQVLLHQHPLNAQRSAQGQAVVNSLWFWGGGRHPQQVQSPFGQVRSPDPLLQAIAAHAPAQAEGEQLVDLRHLRQPQALIEQALLPLLAALGRGELSTLLLDFEHGPVYRLRRGQRWRIWRGAQAGWQR